MRTGTKSILIGVHCILWHPLTVGFAWHRLYDEWPTWREWVCIFLHDVGYALCSKMDDERGEQHPVLGAYFAGLLFGQEYRDLVLWHSRHLAQKCGREPSKLCWPDKLSITLEPKKFYLFRARLSGELEEYRENSAHLLSRDASDEEWFDWIQKRFRKLAQDRKQDVSRRPGQEGHP